MEDIFAKRSKLKKYKVANKPVVNDFEGEDSPITQGMKSSSLGQLLGYQQSHPTSEATIPESLAFKAGAIGGDVPAMMGGSTLGGALAGLLGGGPIGAAIGAGAGAFGLPELIKQIASYVRSPEVPNESLVNKAGSIGDILLQTGKQAVVGGATGGAGRLFPLLKMAPGLSKIAGTKIGQEAIKGATELAAMTGAQSAIEGELPTAREVAENALLLGGMKVAGKGASAIGKAFGKKPLPKATTETVHPEIDIFKKRALELAPKKVATAIEKFKKEQPAFDLLRKHIGERNERIVESQFKWNKAAANAQGKEPFTSKQLEEAIYYRQKTGNPEIKSDTYESLKDRIPESLRKVVDTDINQHFDKSRKDIGDHPILKSLNPKEEFTDRFSQEFYKNPEKIDSAYDKVSKKLRFGDPLSGMDRFLDFNELLKKEGLQPRHNNIFDVMRSYDRTVAKMIAGADLLKEIPKHDFERSSRLPSEGVDSDNRIIVTDRDPLAYQRAKNSGYIPFDDMTLRRYSSDGRFSDKPSVSPALVSPEFAGAFQGIFSKKAFTPKSPFWKTYDNVADMVRFGRVKLSFFHYVPLTESSAGALGIKKAFSFRSLAKEGAALRSSESFMKDAAKSGLVIHKPVERYERTQKMGNKLFDQAMKYLPEKVVTKAQNSLVAKGLDKLAKSQKYLFEEYHPTLKTVTWNDFVNKSILERIKEGNPPTEAQRTQIKTQMADVVNSMYGGQNWDIQRVFNSKEYRRWLRRAIAYPDWTTSAIRQAAGGLSGGLKGEASRRYWLKFGINAALAHGALKFVFGGMKQTDEDKSVKGIRWDPAKAVKEVWEPDPIEWYKFPLPDIPVKIAGKEFNPGKEADKEYRQEGSRKLKFQKGAKLRSHFGKQALEIKDWVKHPLNTLFNKSNPIVSMIWKQVLDTTPSERESFAVRGEWKKGARQRMPWDATEPYTAGRLFSRLASVVEDVSPFSMRTLFDKGPAPYLATGLGSVPISKGATPYKAAPALEKAFKKNDTNMVNRIREALRDNGFKSKQINAVVNSARKRAR